MCSTSYILVVHESIPFTQNIVVSDADHTSDGTDMDALGPHRPIQRMAVTDGLKKNKQQREELKVQSFCFAHILQVYRDTHNTFEKSHPGLSFMKNFCLRKTTQVGSLYSHSPSGPRMKLEGKSLGWKTQSEIETNINVPWLS